MNISKDTIKKLIGLILFTFLVYAIVEHFDSFVSAFNYIFDLLKPFLLGALIAFVLNVMMSFVEEKIVSKIIKKHTRAISLILSLLLLVLIIYLLLFLIIPEITQTFTIISERLPQFVNEFSDNINGLTEKLPFEITAFEDIDLDWSKIGSWLSTFLGKGSSAIFSTTLGITSSIVGAIFNLLIGFVFSLYILAQKETLSRQFKKLMFAYLPKKYADKILSVMHTTNDIFTKFIKGQFIEAIIIGALCFVGMLILRLPYAPVISVMVGVSALIPVFGAFIGTAIGALLILMDTPIKALWFLIFIVVLQQLEGNLIYPKVVGSSIGLPGIWVLVAVTVGGSAFGVLGMLIGVPLTSVIYTLVKENVHQKSVLNN